MRRKIMEFEIVYPKIKRQSLAMFHVRYIFGLIFLAAAVVCPIVNIIFKGPAWSVIVLWSLYMVWTLCLKLPLVDRNLINLGVRFAVMTVILLVLIDRLIVPGWAAFVVPLVAYAALLVLAVLFFVNVTKQRQNVMPLVLLTLAVAIGSALALFVFSETRWPMIVLACAAAALLIATVFTLRMRLLMELRKRFHLK